MLKAFPSDISNSLRQPLVDRLGKEGRVLNRPIHVPLGRHTPQVPAKLEESGECCALHERRVDEVNPLSCQ
jgi:hypothetical protein